MACGPQSAAKQRNRTLIFRLQQFFEAGQFNVKTIITATGAHVDTIRRRLREETRSGKLLVRSSPGRPRNLVGEEPRRLYQIAVRNPLAFNRLLAARLRESGNVSVS